MKTTALLARQTRTEIPSIGQVSLAPHPAIVRIRGRWLGCRIALLLACCFWATPLHADDCQATYDRAKKYAEETAASSKRLLNKDMMDRRLGPGAYEKEVAKIDEEKNRALNAARKEYNDCVAAEKARKAREDQTRAAPIKQQTEQLEQQVRGIDTRALGRDPKALRQGAEDAKKKAKELEDAAFKHRWAGNSAQASALENQASAYKRGASNMETAAGWEAMKQEDDARKAKQDADKQAAAQVDRQTDGLRKLNNEFNPYTASGDPAALRAQAKQARDNARILRDQATKALIAGNSKQHLALNNQAFVLDRRANELETAGRNQVNQAVRDGLKDAASGVGQELLDVGVDEVLPDIPGRVAGERVRDYLESATDRTKSLVPLADTVGNYISGPVRGEINRHLNSAPSPSRDTHSGGGYSAPSPPSGRSSWRSAPPADDPAEDYEKTVDDAVQDLVETARRNREQQKLNELADILMQPAPSSSAPPPIRRDRFDQPWPTASPLPRRSRFDEPAPTPTRAPSRNFRKFD